jgi:protein SCO1
MSSRFHSLLDSSAGENRTRSRVALKRGPSTFALSQSVSMKAIFWFLVIFITSVITGYFITRDTGSLPVYRPSQINPRLVDSDQRATTNPHFIRDFTLINQKGDTISAAAVSDKVYIANFFFVRCPTICPLMTSNLAAIHKKFKHRADFLILSHTVTPDYDTPGVLWNYSEKYDADQDKWLFLTGDKKEIYDLARRSYFAVLDHGDGEMQDFIHTENIVLIDKRRRIRGFYDGTSSKELTKMRSDIEKLLEE